VGVRVGVEKVGKHKKSAPTEFRADFWAEKANPLVSEGGLGHLRHELLFSVSEQWFLAGEWRLWQLLVASKVR